VTICFPSGFRRGCHPVRSNGLTFDQLTITQGSGINASDTLIAIQGTSEIVASLTGIQASDLTSANFTRI
jgi:hypothetical protein